MTLTTKICGRLVQTEATPGARLNANSASNAGSGTHRCQGPEKRHSVADASDPTRALPPPDPLKDNWRRRARWA